MILSPRPLKSLPLAILLTSILEIAKLILINNAPGDTGSVAQLSADLRAGRLGAGAVHVRRRTAVGDVVSGCGRDVGQGEESG